MTCKKSSPGWKSFCIFLNLVSFVSSTTLFAAEPAIAPETVTPKPNSEYYSAKSAGTLLMPVQVWGEVREPGIHHLSPNASLLDAIGSAGGPMADSEFPTVYVYRQPDKKIKVDAMSEGLGFKLKSNDTIHVESDYLKSNLPLVFGGITVAVSIATLALVLVKNK